MVVLVGSACAGEDRAQGSGHGLRSGADDDRGGPSAAAVPADAEAFLQQCVRGGGPVGMIHVVFACDSITVYSCKDLSNVVLEFENGERERFEGLEGQVGTFSGTAGGRITGVWVKAGANFSGDGPGYGQRFDAPDEDCEIGQGGAGGAGGSGGSAGTCGDSDPDESCGPVGGVGGTGDDTGGDPLCIANPNDPRCQVE
jgi:hypothetical protein